MSNKEQKKISFTTGNYLKIIIDKDEQQLIFTNNEGKPLITSLDHVKPMDDYVGWEPLEDGTYRVICKGLQQDITLTYDMSNFIQPNFDVDLNLSFWIIPSTTTTFYLVQGDQTLPLNIVKIGNTSTGGQSKNIVGGDNILVDDSTPNTAIINLSPDLSNIYSISGSGDQALTLEAGNISLETSILDTQNKIELGSSGITLQSIDGDNSASVQVSPSGVMINDNVITFSTQPTEGNPIITNTDLQNAISNIPTPSSITNYDQLTNKPWTHQSDPFASWISVQEGIGEVDAANVPVSVKGLYVSSESGGTDAGIHLDPNSTNWHIIYKESDGKVHIRGMAQEWDDGSPLIADGASALSADSYLLNVRKDASGNIERNWLKVSDVETGNDVLITTLSFTNPTVGVSQTFNFSDVSAIHGIIETGAVLYATNGIGLVTSVNTSNSTLVASFIAAYTTSIPNTLAVASSINAEFNSTTGLLEIKITDYAGQVHDTTASISVGEYEHTFTFESNDNKNYKIDASTIQYFESNSSLFSDNTSFIAYLNAHEISSITGLNGSVTNLYPDEIDIDLSSIELGDEVIDIKFSMDTQINPDHVTWFQLESKTTFSIGPGEISGHYVIRVKPNDLDAVTIYDSVIGFSNDVSVPGIFDWKENTRKLTFNELNTKIVDASNLPFTYHGKIQVGTKNEYYIDGGVPLTLTYLSSQGSWMWEVIDAEDNLHEIPFVGELSIAKDTVGSAPVPSTDNYDMLQNKPFALTHTNLEKYIDNIKKISNSAKKLATSAQATAGAAAAEATQALIAINTPAPVPVLWPHVGLRFLIPTMQAAIAANDAAIVAATTRMDGLEVRIRNLEDEEAHGQLTINVTNDTNLYGISITDTSAPSPHHRYTLGIKNAATGNNTTAGPEYCITPNPNFLGVDEGKFIKLNRFNALHNTILTFQYDQNQFGINANEHLCLRNDITWNNNVLFEDIATVNTRNYLFMQDNGIGWRRTTGLISNQITLDDNTFTVALNNDQDQYIFTRTGLGMVNKGIHDLADPLHDQDAATKKYVDDHGGGTDDYDELQNKPIVQQGGNAAWVAPNAGNAIMAATAQYTRIRNKDDQTNALLVAIPYNIFYNTKGKPVVVANEDSALFADPSGNSNNAIRISEFGTLVTSGEAKYLFGETLNMQGNRIENLPDPEGDTEPATKSYVDAAVSAPGGDYNALDHKPIIQTAGQSVWVLPTTNLPVMSVENIGAANRKVIVYNWNQTGYALIFTEAFTTINAPGGVAAIGIADDTVVMQQPGSARNVTINSAGVYINSSGANYLFNSTGLNMNNKRITALAAPTALTDATTKAYVDTALQNGVPFSLVSGTWYYTGGSNAINMAGSKLTNISLPTANTDVATKSYVDQAISDGGNWSTHTLILNLNGSRTVCQIYNNTRTAFTTQTFAAFLQARGFTTNVKFYPASGSYKSTSSTTTYTVIGVIYYSANYVSYVYINPNVGVATIVGASLEYDIIG